jgi:hypothetical protein
LYTPHQLVDVARRNQRDLSQLVPMLNGHAHARGRSQIIMRKLWIEGIEEPRRTRAGRSVQAPATDPLLEYPPHAATCWILAHDVRATVPLWYSLNAHGMNGGKRSRWRPYVYAGGDRAIFVTTEVARLVVAEHGPCASLFNAEPRLRPWLLEVDALMWNKHFARAHSMLTERLRSWYELGVKQLRGWIDGGGP